MTTFEHGQFLQASLRRKTVELPCSTERVLDLYWDTSPRDPNKTVPVILSTDCHMDLTCRHNEFDDSGQPVDTQACYGIEDHTTGGQVDCATRPCTCHLMNYR